MPSCPGFRASGLCLIQFRLWRQAHGRRRLYRGRARSQSRVPLCGDQTLMRTDERGLRKSVWLSADRPSLLHRLRSVGPRSEEHTSELQSLMRISYAVFCLNKKNKTNKHKQQTEELI